MPTPMSELHPPTPWAAVMLSDREFDALIEVGREVLIAFPDTPGACVMMSALYAGRLRALGHASASLVGGALSVAGVFTFGRQNLDRRFDRTNLDWDGHAWIAFGEYVADVSLLRTARSPSAPLRLKRFVTSRFKPTQGLYIATVGAALREDRLGYVGQHVFSDEQIDALYRGALTFLAD